MKKLILLSTIALFTFSCHKVDELKLNDGPYEKEIENQVSKELLNIGISEENVTKLMLEAIIPNQLLENKNTYKTNKKNGAWRLTGGSGPGTNGPLADACDVPGKSCKRTSGPIHPSPIEINILLNGNTRSSILDINGKYPEDHIYTNYLSIVYN